MKILPITQLKFYNIKQNTQQPQKNYVQNNTYNPIAYNDLTFTARLFRTPEDFYSCPFNKNGMPETMKQYLNADYEDRQHMPPQQMMALVFEDIKTADSLKQIKGKFPDEPLFKNLTDVPNKKAQKGILAEIAVMKEDGKTLFKNGKDNLGLYILKKIYLEGKTLKEINEDFNKDRSVYYNGLSPIEYDTLRAFGIKFPNNGFWKSFTHNRKNFNYTYTPRKPKETPTTTHKPLATPVRQQRNRFAEVKDWEIDKLTDALVKGNGSATETRKRLKNSSVRDEASLNFVAKYMGEINAIVLDRLHISPDMKDYFANYDDLSKSQKQKFAEYWQKNPEMNKMRSLLMSDTIKLFFLEYGADGQNERFQQLLEYARNIKPNRIAQMEELEKAHNLKQAYYDEMFAELDAQEQQSLPASTENAKSFEELLEETKAGFNVQEYRFNTDEGEIVILSNLSEALKESLQAETEFMPSQYANKYIKFVTTNTSIEDSYILSKLLSDKGITLPEDDRLIDKKEVENITNNLYEDFNDINLHETRAAQQAVTDAFIKAVGENYYNINMFQLGVFEFITLYKCLPPELTNRIKQQSSYINQKYAEYKKPLTNNELNKISLKIIELMRKYDPEKSIVSDNINTKGMQAVFYSVSKYLNNKAFNKELFKRELNDYIKSYGGASRYFLDKNVSDDLKMSKLEQFLSTFAYERSGVLGAFATLDAEGMEYIRQKDLSLYMTLNKISQR